jgi:hypothetical protein
VRAAAPHGADDEELRPVLTVMDAPKRIPGYVRCGVTHIECEWEFEVLDEQERVAIVDIQTEDGPISIGLNRQEAEGLLRTLTLFLQDWPKDQAKS